MDGCDLAALFDHALCVGGGSLYLTADRSVYDGSDLCDHLVEITALFCDQGRVGGHTADNAHIVCFTDLVYICGIYEKFHDLKFPLGLIILWKL